MFEMMTLQSVAQPAALASAQPLTTCDRGATLGAVRSRLRATVFAACACALVAGTAGVSAATPKPRPATAQKAIALVRASHDMSEEAAPFAHELGWKAEWRGDRWWVIGLFSSQ
jgi:hypothetical protein